MNNLSVRPFRIPNKRQEIYLGPEGNHKHTHTHRGTHTGTHTDRHREKERERERELVLAEVAFAHLSLITSGLARHSRQVKNEEKEDRKTKFRTCCTLFFLRSNAI